MSSTISGNEIVLSLVIPLYNEEESVPELTREIVTVCEKESIPFEIIFIDDGSTDGSFSVLENLQKKDGRIKVIQFRKNFGKSEGLAAGFERAKGRYVITMDADLQDDPAEIPTLIAKLEEGYDLVSGWKKKRHDPISKRWPSKFYNAVTSNMTGLKLHDFNCGLKIYRSEVVKSIYVYGELHRYIPALAHLQGFRVTEMVVHHRARKYSVSKFGGSRFLKGPLDLMTILFFSRYTQRPLHLFGLLGLIATLLGGGITLYLIIMRIFKNAYLSNRPLLFIAIMMLIMGIQFFSIGLLGEMLTRSQADKHRFSIRKVLGE